MITSFRATVLTLAMLVGGLGTAQAQSRERCSFKCDWIPALEDALMPLSAANGTELRDTRVRVLAWNVYKGRERNFFADFKRLGAQHDIVMISEATDGPEVKPAFQSLPGFGWDFGVSFYMNGNVATGLASGSTARPTSLKLLRTKDREPFVKSYKVTLVTTYAHRPSGQQLMAINIHGINWASDDAFERQIRDAAVEIARHKGPVVFAGDFNINNSARMPIIEKVLGPLGLKRVPWRNPISGKQLDDAFTRGVIVHEARLLMDVIDRSSDHPAISLDLEIAP